MRRKRDFEESSGNVFADLGFRNAKQELLKAKLTIEIYRLLKKRAIAAQRDGRRYLYRPLLKREDYVHVASKNLLDRLFDGRVAPLVAHFSERRKLSKKDIAELKRLIEEIDHDR